MTDAGFYDLTDAKAVAKKRAAERRLNALEDEALRTHLARCEMHVDVDEGWSEAGYRHPVHGFVPARFIAIIDWDRSDSRELFRADPQSQPGGPETASPPCEVASGRAPKVERRQEVLRFAGEQLERTSPALSDLDLGVATPTPRSDRMAPQGGCDQ